MYGSALAQGRSTTSIVARPGPASTNTDDRAPILRKWATRQCCQVMLIQCVGNMHTTPTIHSVTVKHSRCLHTAVALQ